MKKILLLFLLLPTVFPALAQLETRDGGYNQIDENGTLTTPNQRRNNADSLGSDKEIPKGLHMWTVDRRFGDRQAAPLDTLSHMFMNTIFTSGLRGEYNTTGNLGAPRQARILIDRRENDRQFIFTNPYDFFIVAPDSFRFTNTLSPFTNISYNTCGDRTNGEDHFTAKFGVNAGRRIGAGFKFDYLYGRGYYSNQSTSHFNYTMYGSYIGDRYQAHLLLSTNHQKVTENGGISDDNYITHPESFNENFQTSEIPTMLSSNWNRNDNQHVFLTQRYSLGFTRKVRMTQEEIDARKFAMASQQESADRQARDEAAKTARKQGRKPSTQDLKAPATFAGRPDGARIAEGPAHPDSATVGPTAGQRIAVDSKATADSLLSAAKKAAEDTAWLKTEYVPVTSFIHTAELNSYRRIYEAYATPANYYLDKFTVQEKLPGDSIYDQTRHWSLRNTFAVSLLEGFNKWAKAGLKGFLTHELRHFTLPDATSDRSWNENAVSVGGQLGKTAGRTVHYHALAEFGIAGINAGELHLDGGADLNFPLLGDTMTLAATGFYHREKPSFYYRHYQSRHYWWDNDGLSMTDHLRLQGILRYRKTRTTLRVAVDELRNHAYFAATYTTSSSGRLYNALAVKQKSGAISLLTAELAQDLTFGPLNWESVVTFQKSTDDDVLPAPTINVYTNLYLRFKIARVLKCDFGGDARYFTSYTAPEYVPGIGQYALQGNESKVKVGNYPIVNVYANFHLQHTRFFVMMSHANAGSGKKNYFLAPHYPLNGSIIRFGLSWNFYN